MTDRDTKRKLFAEHVAANPPSEAKKTKALEQRYGHLGSSELAAIAASDPSKRHAREATLFLALALVAVVVAVLLAGCANPVDAALRSHVEAIEKAWPVIRDKSQPAAGVDSGSYGGATAAMDRAVRLAGEAARAE